MRRAVIDIGTNTLLLLVVERGPDGVLHSVLDLCRFGRLGQGLDKTGYLADEAIERSLDICREFHRELTTLGVTAPTVVATQAMREAKNSADFTVHAEAILGSRIEIIPGEREADLAFRFLGRSLVLLHRTGWSTRNCTTTFMS